MTGPRPDTSKAARYDALRRAGKSHVEAVAEIEDAAATRPSPLLDMARSAGFDPDKADPVTPETPRPDVPMIDGYRNAGKLLRTGAQGATLGFSDELRGLAEGAAALVPGGRSPGEAYRGGRDAERQALGEFREDFPKSALAAEMIGGVVVPGVGFGASAGRAGAKMGLGQIVKQGAKIGGLTGAAYGVGSADDGIGDRIKGGLTGGLAGTVGGAVLPLAIAGGGKVARNLAERVGSSSRAPQSVQTWAAGSRAAGDADAGAATVLHKLQQDNITPEDLVSRVAEARGVGISDVAIPDLAGRNTRGLIDLAASRPGPAQEAVEQFGEQRAGGMRSMLADAFETVSRIPRQMVREVREGLVQQRKVKANDLFERAFDDAGFMDDPRLLAAVEAVEEASPTFQRKALELARLHKVTPSQLVTEARVPTGVAMQNAQSQMGRVGPRVAQAAGELEESLAGARRVPSLRYAHYLKEALDEEIARAQQLVGNGGSGSRLSGLMGLKEQLRDAATSVSPGYRQALQEYAGDSEMLRALSVGEKVLHANVDPEDLAATVAAMTQGEQQMFRVAGLNAMRGFLESNAPLAPAATRAWWNDPRMRGKMELLLGTPEQTEKFLKAVGLTRNKMLTGAAGGGSQTFARSAANQELGEVMGMNPGELIGAMRGSPVGPMQALARRGQSALMGNRLKQAAPFLTATGGDLDQRLVELALLMGRRGTQAAGRTPQQVAGGVAIPLLRDKNP